MLRYKKHLNISYVFHYSCGTNSIGAKRESVSLEMKTFCGCIFFLDLKRANL